LKSGKNRFLYVLFYLLFSPDTWRILIGLLSALIIGPMATSSRDYTPAGQAVIWLMILAIFYALSAPVGKFISKKLTLLLNSRIKS
jgi:hypothetical protein